MKSQKDGQNTAQIAGYFVTYIGASLIKMHQTSIFVSTGYMIAIIYNITSFK